MIFTLLGIFILIYILLGILFFIGVMRIPVSQPVHTNLPKVSVLVSCRNEEKDLPACIHSLANLDYPKSLLQIIFVDDFSTDLTPEILEKARSENSNIEFYSSKEFPETELEAKARGISYAASKATGEWLFITDADSRMPSSWIKHMLHNTTQETGIISGTMEPLNPTFVGSLEKIVSLFKMFIAFGIAGFGLSFFALGPNMAIRKKAYDDAGGLENADFRIAEDMALFKMAHDNGYKTTYHFDHHTFVKLTPVDNLKQLFSQQRRWIVGGFEGDSNKSMDWVIITVLFSFVILFAVFFIYICFAHPFYGLILALGKLLAESIVYIGMKIRYKSPGLFRLIPLTFFYTLFTYIWLPMSFLFSRDTAWMGTGYKVEYKN